MYMLPKGFPLLMNIKALNPYVVLSGNAQDIIKKDIGGALYELSAESFHKTPQSALANYEMVSKKPVIPLNETDYENVIRVLNKEGIAIYFVDTNTFDKLIMNPKQDSIVQTLDRYFP